jgi:hypothetical protein
LTCGFVESAFTSNWGCNLGGASKGGAVVLVVVLFCCGACRRRRSSVVLALVLAASTARADDPPAAAEASVEPQPPPPTRYVTVTVDPLILMIDRRGANVEIVPKSHHGLILTVFHVDAVGTERTNFPVFTGLGGEFGYRYYYGNNGPRGLFIGPSLLLGKYTGTPGMGDSVSFHNVGGALDLGYQAILSHSLVVGLGVGLQATWASYEFPRQDLPVSIYANSGIRARFFTALGYAF